MIFLFSVCKGNSTLRSCQGLRKFGSEKILSSFAVRFFPLEPLTALRVPLWKWQGKKKKSVAMQCVSTVCIPMRYVYIARSVLVGQFLLFSLCSKRFFAYLRGMEVRRNEKITFRCSALEKAALSEQAARCGLSTSEYCRSLSLGGRPRERYTEEERELLRDIARLKGTLQRLNNYFGGRQYREVFEENRTLITELQKILSR